MMTKERLLQIAHAAEGLSMDGRFSFLKDMKFEYAYDRDDAYYFFLALLCEANRPKLVVDLGTCEGVSSYCMAVFSPLTRVVTLDRDTEWRRDICRLANIEAFEQDTENPLSEKLDAELKDIELLYVDTYHEGWLAQAEFDRWRPRMARGSVMLFDGCTWPERPSMSEWWESFDPIGCEKIDLHFLHKREGAGFGAVIVP